MAKRRKKSGGVVVPKDCLVISAVPNGLESFLVGLPAFGEMSDILMPDGVDGDRLALLLDSIMQLLMEEITEHNAAIVRSAINESRQRFAQEVEDLQVELARVQERAEAERRRAT